MPEPVQVRQWGGADVVHSWALGQDHRRSCLSGHDPWPGSPRAQHLLLLGKHRQLPPCLMPAQCDPAATWAGRNLRPQRPESAGGPSEAWSTQLWSACCPEDPRASDTSGSRALPSQTHPAEEARPHKPIFLSSSCTPAGRSQPGTTDLG